MLGENFLEIIWGKIFLKGIIYSLLVDVLYACM